MSTTEHSEPGRPLAVPLSDPLGLVAKLRDPAQATNWGAADNLMNEAADEIERLRRVLSVVRRYPDFDGGGPLAEAMDQALAGKSPELLEVLERLVAVGVEGPNVAGNLTARQGRST